MKFWSASTCSFREHGKKSPVSTQLHRSNIFIQKCISSQLRGQIQSWCKISNFDYIIYSFLLFRFVKTFRILNKYQIIIIYFCWNSFCCEKDIMNTIKPKCTEKIGHFWENSSNIQTYEGSVRPLADIPQLFRRPLHSLTTTKSNRKTCRPVTIVE